MFFSALRRSRRAAVAEAEALASVVSARVVQRLALAGQQAEAPPGVPLLQAGQVDGCEHDEMT